jgi:hypothetical protein
MYALCIETVNVLQCEQYLISHLAIDSRPPAGQALYKGSPARGGDAKRLGLESESCQT